MDRFQPALFSFVAILAAIVWSTGCANSGPRMSGMGLGQNRVVHVGDIVELRTPIDERGSREWRVSSYDSLYLSLIERPRIVQRSDGNYEMVARARAMAPGETTVDLVEVKPGVQSPRSLRFNIRILE